MNRYKPVGWRNESYRHSLAAKGIRTSFKKKRIDVGIGWKDEFDIGPGWSEAEKDQFQKMFKVDAAIKKIQSQVGKEPSPKVCEDASQRLSNELKKIGVEHHVIYGSYGGEPHVWVELGDGSIIDVTKKQFGNKKGEYEADVSEGWFPDD